MVAASDIPNGPVRNALTIDVEDWFQVQNYVGVIPRADWDRLERRVEANTDRLLSLLEAAGVRATFFTLGWVAERHKSLVRRIVASGHELASHGYGHELVIGMGEARFRADLRRAKAVLEDAGGVAVTGYRAPTFSLEPGRTPWAHAVLAETGHAYSSSVFPGRHGASGTTATPLSPWRPHADGVIEIPMTALRPPVLGRDLPVSGGGWFRLAPYPAFAWALRRVNRREQRRGVFYLHPWEVDPAQPRVAGMPLIRRVKHFTGLASTESRLARLLRDFRWARLDEVFAAEIAGAWPASRGRAAARPALEAAG